MRLTYKIVVNPNTFKLILVEIQVPEPLDLIQRLQQRDITPKELSYTNEAEFRDKIKESGYGYSVDEWLIQEEVMFQID